MSYYKKIKPQSGEALSTPAATRAISSADIQAAIDRARVMRAEQAGIIARGVAKAVKAAVHKLLGGVIQSAKQRRAIAYLNGMSDHDLRDIGLTRAEIVRTVVYGPAADSLRARKAGRRVVVGDAMADALLRRAA